MKTELTLLEADKSKVIGFDQRENLRSEATIDFICREYLGTEVFLLDENDKVIEYNLTNKSDLQPGIKVCITTLFGDYISGSLLALLEFDADDRSCWISTGAMNIKAIKSLNKNVNNA